MTPVNVAKRNSLFRKWLRYDGKLHKFVPVKIDPKEYRLIGHSGSLEFYTLIK